MRHPELSYRLVAGPKEMEKVRRLLAVIGEPLPHYLLSCAWVAENPKGQVVGLSQLQSVPLIEPFNMILDGYDGGEVMRKLFEMTREFVLASGVPRVLMHPNHPAMKRMLMHVGARPMADQFWDWRKGEQMEGEQAVDVGTALGG